MADPILVTGGTGVLGRLVVERLVADGCPVRVMSRRPRPRGDDRPGVTWATADLASGTGVDAAVAGVRAIVHCATALNGRREPELARVLVDAARRAGAPHLVYVSIVGVDRVPFPYYRGKLAAETLIEESGVPCTIQRATQFHDLLRTVFAAAAKSPLMPVPAIPFQPVDAAEVADRLARLAEGPPVGRAGDMGGPQVRDARALARAYLTATGRRRLLLPVRLPGAVFAAYRRGGHLAPDHAVGEVTFEAYLAARADSLRTASYRGTRRRRGPLQR